MPRNSAASVFDRLLESESPNRTGPYPVHKQIAADNDGLDVVDWILTHVAFHDLEWVLDAGCGTGDTLCRLAKTRRIYGRGISISGQEVRFAASQALKQGLSASLEFRQASFDEPHDRSYDKIIAIESLKHSPDVQRSIVNLARAVSESGAIIVIEDFLAAPCRTARELSALWHAPGFLGLDAYLRILNAAGEFEVTTQDFTSRVRTRPMLALRFLIPLLRLARFCVTGKLRLTLEIHLGGLLLEWLYKTRQASYILILARKRPRTKGEAGLDPSPQLQMGSAGPPPVCPTRSFA